MAGSFDILVIGDSRFQGGTTAAMVADVTAFSALGLSVGLLFVRSAYLHDDRDPANPAALALADLDGVTLLAPGSAARGRFAFLHHPMIFFLGLEAGAALAAERAVIVTHHPPFRADGSLEYDPISTVRKVQASFGLSTWYAPVSDTLRQQLQSFSPLIRLTGENWPNVFNIDAWPTGPEVFTGERITIGRHGRADGLKWPATGPEIMASLLATPDVAVRVLGCPRQELEARGADLSRWDVLEFGAETPQAFLASLDAFVYHYHPAWVEAFGRTVAEAALTGRICLLDPRLEANFGDMALYCQPSEVADVLGRLRSDPADARARAAAGQALARQRHGLDSVGGRLEHLRRDVGTGERRGASRPPMHVLRKLAGLYRRRAQGSDG